MSKRDDDSQSDMEVGMTTAERRRRRRRGGGLRVPSDNVPRRSSTPPVVAPVPEDPALAMSIAYSFSGESSDPMRTTLESQVPTFENHEGMPTVIDPVSEQVEQAEQVEQGDFEMKTREMTAVDLEALGLSDAGTSGNNLPIQRLSSPTADSLAGAESSGLAVRFRKRDATDPVDDVDVELDSIDSLTDGGTTLDQDEEDDEDDAESSLPEVDSSEFSTIDPGDEPSDSEPVDELPEDYSRIGPPVKFRIPRAQTVALSEDDLEEMREAARFQAPARPISTSMPPPMPPAKSTEIRIRQAEQSSPEIDISSLVERASEAASDFDVDVEGEAGEGDEAAAAPPPAPMPPTPPVPPVPPPGAEARTRTPSQPPGHGHPPSNPPPLHSHPPSNPPPIGPQPRDSQPIPIIPVQAQTQAQAPHAQPPPPPGAHKAPPAPPPAKRDKAPTAPVAMPLAAQAPLPATLPTATPVPGTPPAMPPTPPPPPAQAASAAPHAVPPPVPPPHAAPPPVPPPTPHVAPSPPPVPHAAPPPPPAVASAVPPAIPQAPPPAATPAAPQDGRPSRIKAWFIDLFDEDYLRTLPFLTPQATQAEAEFVIDAMGLSPGAQLLDVGCGYGRHAMELAARGFHVVGLDLSTPLLVRGGEEAHRRGLTINFIRGDMRELDFEAQFDGAYCLFSTFGYFDEETNKKTVANIARALRPGGRLLIEILNRDYVIADLPTRVWWEGDGCVVLEEVELNYFTSRIQVNRSVVFDDGRQLEQLISVRAYSLHEVGKLLHGAGLRVLEVSGAYHTRGRFFGNQSRHIIVLAERKETSAQ